MEILRIKPRMDVEVRFLIVIDTFYPFNSSIGSMGQDSYTKYIITREQ
jgi:hypothetical protein